MFYKRQELTAEVSVPPGDTDALLHAAVSGISGHGCA